eukprot:3662570-Prymnesium_polylepis.1
MAKSMAGASTTAKRSPAALVGAADEPRALVVNVKDAMDGLQERDNVLAGAAVKERGASPACTSRFEGYVFAQEATTAHLPSLARPPAWRVPRRRR